MGFGGNTAETLQAFASARNVLGMLLEDARFSSLYRSSPQLDTEQDDFWNAAAAGGWGGSAESLLERLLMLEARLGRLRDPARPKGPRVLDLDLLHFGRQVAASPRLTVPHPGLPYRRFALDPLVELEPALTDPRTGRPWAESAFALGPQGVDRTDRTW